jgi:hypothetical protein
MECISATFPRCHCLSHERRSVSMWSSGVQRR